MRYFALFLLLIVAGCIKAGSPAPTLDELAGHYVRLTLEIGAHEEGYIDAYFGPPEWKEQADSEPRTTEELKSEAERIIDALNAIDASEHQPLDQHRVAWLLAHVTSARFRLDMIEGTRLPFREEATHVFALTPDLLLLQSYDPVIARIEAMLPGEAPLAVRVEEFRERYTIPEDRIGDSTGRLSLHSA